MTVILVAASDPVVIPGGVDVTDPHLFVADSHTYRSPNYLTPAQLPVPRNSNTIVEHVIHKTEGRIAGDMSRLLSRAAQVSCHAYCPRDIGPGNMRYFQVVDDANEAWQCGVANKADQLDGAFRQYLGWDNENFRSVGDEMEGGETEEFTQWQMVWAVWRQVQLCKTYPHMLMDRDHIIGHYQITRQKSDPQLFPWGGFMNAVSNAMQPQGNQPLWLPGGKYPITQADFVRFYKAEPKAMMYWGLPISEAHQQVLGDGKNYLVQYFERARFELHLESGAPAVGLGLLGDEVLALARP